MYVMSVCVSVFVSCVCVCVSWPIFLTGNSVAAYCLGFRRNERKINECDRRTSLFTVQFPAQQSKERKKKLYNITYCKILFAIKEKWSRGFKTWYLFNKTIYKNTHWSIWHSNTFLLHHNVSGSHLIVICRCLYL